MTWFVYKRHCEHDFLIRHDLGEHFVDRGDETPGAVWVRLDVPCDTFEQALTELEQFAREGKQL